MTSDSDSVQDDVEIIRYDTVATPLTEESESDDYPETADIAFALE